MTEYIRRSEMNEFRIVRMHWRLIAIMFLVIFQLVAIAFGWILFAIGGDVLFITFHVAVMLFYKLEQKRRAYLYNRSSMRITRIPIAEQLGRLHKERAIELSELAQKYITFDAFKYRLGIKIPEVTDEQWRGIVKLIFGQRPPSVSIVVPIYDIEHEILRRQIQSIYNQTYPNLRNVYPVLNDDTDVNTFNFLTDLVTEYNRGHTQFVVMVEGTPGKREAQNTGFQRCFADGSEIIGNMDGDGFAHEDAVTMHVLTFLSDSKIGLTTGDVRVINWGQNFLTMMTGIRYFNAFWDDRGAHSYVKQMLCGSGPNMFMRAQALKEIVDDWYNDEFRGVRIQYGDDRALTQFMLEADYKTVFVPDAISWTDCPVDLPTYKRQQKRWTRSWYRYNFKMIQSGLLYRLDPFGQFTTVYLMFYPFVMVFAIAFVLGRAGIALEAEGIDASWDILYPYVLSIGIVGLVFQSTSGLVLMHSLKFLLAPLYSLIWFAVQLPIRFTAPLDLLNPSWETRKKRG